MFSLETHQRSFHHNLHTVVPGVLPAGLCDKLAQRAAALIQTGRIHLVDHEGTGSESELDQGGKYLHHMFLGEDVREHMPEIVAVYHALLGQIAAITCGNAVISPHPESDINIVAYPPGGGTMGMHLDTNGITVLIYLTTNTEGQLVLQIPHSHPGEPETTYTEKSIFAEAGAMLVMQGRKVWHVSVPTRDETKMVAVLNYYYEGDTWRPAHFDKFVYAGLGAVSGNPAEIACLVLRKAVPEAL